MGSMTNGAVAFPLFLGTNSLYYSNLIVKLSLSLKLFRYNLLKSSWLSGASKATSLRVLRVMSYASKT